MRPARLSELLAYGLVARNLYVKVASLSSRVSLNGEERVAYVHFENREEGGPFDEDDPNDYSYEQAILSFGPIDDLLNKKDKKTTSEDDFEWDVETQSKRMIFLCVER